MVTEIKSKYATMYLSAHAHVHRYTIIVYYNHYSLFDFNIEGLFHRYGDGDSKMDLTDKKGLKIVGVDIL